MLKNGSKHLKSTKTMGKERICTSPPFLSWYEMSFWMLKNGSKHLKSTKTMGKQRV